MSMPSAGWGVTDTRQEMCGSRAAVGLRLSPKIKSGYGCHDLQDGDRCLSCVRHSLHPADGPTNCERRTNTCDGVSGCSTWTAFSTASVAADGPQATDRRRRCRVEVCWAPQLIDQIRDPHDSGAVEIRWATSWIDHNIAESRSRRGFRPSRRPTLPAQPAPTVTPRPSWRTLWASSIPGID